MRLRPRSLPAERRFDASLPCHLATLWVQPRPLDLVAWTLSSPDLVQPLVAKATAPSVPRDILRWIAVAKLSKRVG